MVYQGFPIGLSSFNLSKMRKNRDFFFFFLVEQPLRAIWDKTWGYSNCSYKRDIEPERGLSPVASGQKAKESLSSFYKRQYHSCREKIEFFNFIFMISTTFRHCSLLQEKKKFIQPFSFTPYALVIPHGWSVVQLIFLCK